ncbi:hypothetical protein ABEO51_08785 [Bacillus safensis]
MCAPAEGNGCAMSLIVLDLVLFQYKGAEILVHMLYFLSEQQTLLIGRRSFFP